MAPSPARTQQAELDAGLNTTSNNRPPLTPLTPLSSLGFETVPPTYAAFSPSLAGTAGSHRRSTILLHQKSPLLLATPPQITRALAYSYPFLTPINTFLGLISWSSGDPWESFLLVAAWWAIILYGDFIILIAGPLVVVAGLILGMYGRRFSLLSSSGWSEFTAGTNLSKLSNFSKAPAAAAAATGQPATTPLAPSSASSSAAAAAAAAAQPQTAASGSKQGPTGAGHRPSISKDYMHDATGSKHQKTLDEIVATLRELTTRCNLILEPMLEMTDFLSTQRTATTASTRPALTTLFVRLLICTPIWWALTLPPLRIVTTRRVLLVFGTIVLTWHSRVMRVARAILWRSRTVRNVAGLVTGLRFQEPPVQVAAATAGAVGDPGGTGETAGQLPVKRESELTKAVQRQQRARGGEPAGVRFTFIIYENQRRWVGLGWTTSLFSYERSAWTDEHNSPMPSRDDFTLPEVEEGTMARWRWGWVEGSNWRVEGLKEDLDDYDTEAGKMGWVYYDNKWQNGRRGQDGWARWTRRRKWYRDAELVELSEEELAALAEAGDESARAADDEAEGEPGSKANGGGGGGLLPPSLSDPGTKAAPHGSESGAVLAPQVSTVNATSGAKSSQSQSRVASTPVELADTSGLKSTGFMSSFGRRSSASAPLEGGTAAAAAGAAAGAAGSAAPSLRERGGDSDAVSIVSTSSRPRGIVDAVLGTVRKQRGVGSVDLSRTGSIAKSSGGATGNTKSGTAAINISRVSGRNRRSSEAESEDADTSLGTTRALQIQKAGGVEDWGVGDEVRMSLE